MTEGPVRADSHAVAAVVADVITARHDSGKAFFVLEFDDGHWLKEIGTILGDKQRTGLDQNRIFAQYAAVLKAIAAQRPLKVLLAGLLTDGEEARRDIHGRGMEGVQFSRLRARSG